MITIYPGVAARTLARTDTVARSRRHKILKRLIMLRVQSYPTSVATMSDLNLDATSRQSQRDMKHLTDKKCIAQYNNATEWKYRSWKLTDYGYKVYHAAKTVI